MTQAPDNPRPQNNPWDGNEELRKLIDGNEELSAIYRKLGYSVYVDRESRRILNQLKSLIGIEVVDPSPSGFGRLLYDARNVRFDQLRESEQRNFLAPGKAGKRARACQAKEAKRENPEQLKAFLNRHPSAMRTVSLLLLEKLDKLFTKAHSTLNAEDRTSLLSAVSRVRDDIRHDSGNGASALQSFEWTLEECLGHRRVGRDFHEDTNRERKARLDELLLNSLWVREIEGQDDAQWHKDAAKQAKTYIDSSWMHTPSLTARFLTDLLDVELAPLTRESKSIGESDLMLVSTIWRLPPFSYYWQSKVARERARLTRLAGLLRQVRDEADSGNYDAQEIARRLRSYESEGLYVHSLVYALLRLGNPNA